MPDLSIITTCKGRLAHLQQTLPLMAGQGRDCEVIVVDYGCPDGTAAWVVAHFPEVKIVEVRAETAFHIARARNLGAQAAVSPWLMFVDADVLLAAGFAAYMRPLLAPGCYYRPAPLTPDTWGSMLVSRDDFLAVGGYDEVLRDWGGEDDDLYHRLDAFAKLSLVSFPGSMVTALTHDDAARTRFFGESDRWFSHRINALYLHIKYDLTLLAGGQTPDCAVLLSVYEEVRRTVRQAAAREAQRMHFTVGLPARPSVPLRLSCLSRTLIYDLELLPGGAFKAADPTAS